MKYILTIIISIVYFTTFSQKKVVKSVETQLQEIEISTIGLDDLVIQNTDSNFIEVTLFAEDVTEQYIYFTPTSDTFQIGFRTESLENESTVFRKFITKRLQRASAVVKIPREKKVVILGENSNITSKNFTEQLTIYIEKGIVKLNKVQATVLVKMYAGTLYAAVTNAKIKLQSNLGKIEIDSFSHVKKFENNPINPKFNFTVNTIKGAIFLSTK